MRGPKACAFGTGKGTGLGGLESLGGLGDMWVSAADLGGEGVKSGWLGANVRCLRG